MACRTELFAKSFFPPAVSLWNVLPEHIKYVDSLSLFKSSVLRSFPNYEVPRHFFFFFLQEIGNTQYTMLEYVTNVVTLILISSTIIFPKNQGVLAVILSKMMITTRYTEPRIKLFCQLHRFHPLNVKLLIIGSTNLSFEDNVTIFTLVHTFITESGRFDRCCETRPAQTHTFSIKSLTARFPNP